MRKEIVNMTAYEEDDGLASFDIRQLRGKVGAFGGAKLMKFVQGDFVNPREGEKIGPEREFYAFGLIKTVQKFVGKQLVETIIVPPHANFPDIQDMNERAPKEEWGVGLDGKPQGPFTHMLILKFVDIKSYERYAFVTNSMGGGVAVGNLTDKCKIARRAHGPNVTAVITCHSTRWQTKFNQSGKRPDFQVERWVILDGDKQLAKPTEAPKAIASSPVNASSIASAPKPDTIATLTTMGPEGLSLKTVSAPTRAQELDDQVPFSGGNKS
jgi:hypothetical protein